MRKLAKWALIFVVWNFIVQSYCVVQKYPSKAMIASAIKSNAPDTTIARLYSEYQYSIAISDPAEAISALKAAADYSLRGHSPLGAASAYSRIGQIFQLLNLNQLALEYFQKSYAISATQSDNGALAYLLSDIANVYFSMKQIEIAEPYYRRGLKLMRKEKNDAGCAVMLNNIALCKMRQNKPDSALVFFEQALKYREKTKDVYLICHSLNYLGMIHMQRGDLSTAEDYFMQVMNKLSAPEKQPELSIQLRSSVEHALWELYDKRGNNLSARKWLDKSLESSKSINDSYSLCSRYLLLSEIDLSANNIPGAKANALKAYQIASKHGFVSISKDVTHQLLSIYLQSRDYDNIAKYFREYSAYSDSLQNMQTTENLTQLHAVIQTNIADLDVQSKQRNQTRIIRFLILSLILTCILVLFFLYAEFTKRRINLRLQQLADASHEVIIIHDMGRIIETNQRVYDTFGYRREDCIGRNILDFIHPDDLSIVQSKMLTHNLQSYEIRILKSNGSIIYVEIMSRPYTYFNKSVRVAAIRDISESKLFIESLVNSSSELRKLNATKDKLFSIIAHDLKNPFNAIIGMSDLMKRNIADYTHEEAIDMISMIHESSTTAHNLLENLLDWARLQTGSLPLYPKSHNLLDALNYAISIQITAINTKKLQINNHIDNHATIFADAKMLNTILLNLISNAVKFTKEGGTISIHHKPTPESDTIDIKDSGIGLSSSQLSKLFKISEMESRLGTNNEPGTGLGLILCKELMELHRGSIKVISTVGKGTTFTLTFPGK
jgi:PAS domain S-box-containing protein